jgi:IS30 family transposase
VLSTNGGIAPYERLRRSSALTLSEREEISRSLAAQCSLRSIAERLRRAPSTISREINRNGGIESYRAAVAELRSWDRARRPKPCKLAANKQLNAVVAERLAIDWSPQQISGWLTRAYKANMEMRISHEAIYRSPWQRGSNENTHRLLRQYLPDGTDLAAYSQADLNDIARKLNTRPRKTLAFMTPIDKLVESLH